VFFNKFFFISHFFEKVGSGRPFFDKIGLLIDKPFLTVHHNFIQNLIS